MQAESFNPIQLHRIARRGFTLVELLIVVVILGILATIVIPQFSNASQQARENTSRMICGFFGCRCRCSRRSTAM